MHSLALKLTLAFLVVGLTGAVLVAVLVGVRTQREFDQFISERNQQELVDQLADYYQQQGSWEGLNAIKLRYGSHRGREGYVPAPVALVDSSQTVVLGTRRYQVGQQLERAELRQALPVEVDGQVVGSVLLDLSPESTAPPPFSPEDNFLARVNQAILLSALGATAIALVLGILLARAISRPVQELTEATQRVAQGELGHQVTVRSKDELGQLGESFNQMSADLATANQLRRQMTADIAHELRTPLSVVLGYTEALADGKLQGNPAIYDAMYGQSQLLSHLVDDLRTLSLADAGELVMNRVVIAPADCLERAAAAHAALAAQRHVTLEVDVSDSLPPILVDRERMAQVLTNLVSNALRYTPEGGTITLSARGGTEEVILQVRDTGPGIEPEHLPRVFKRFYRADPARSTSESGESGLGLAIAQSLVEAQGGTITVTSTVGQGATFTIALPAAARSDDQA